MIRWWNKQRDERAWKRVKKALHVGPGDFYGFVVISRAGMEGRTYGQIEDLINRELAGLKADLMRAIRKASSNV